MTRRYVYLSQAEQQDYNWLICLPILIKNSCFLVAGFHILQIVQEVYIMFLAKNTFIEATVKHYKNC